MARSSAESPGPTADRVARPRPGMASRFGAGAKNPALAIAVLLLIATCGFWLLNSPAHLELNALNLAGNLVFIGVASVVIAIVGIRGFLRMGAWPLLWLGAGSMVFGLGVAISSAFLVWTNANAGVTTHNLSALLAGLLHFMGAFFAANHLDAQHSGPWRWSVVRQVYGGAVALVALIAISAVLGVLPPFFVQGQGGTLLRQLVVGSDTLLFTAAGLIFLRQYASFRGEMVYWYALGLLLTALGLAGILMVTETGSLLSWTGRLSQWAGGVYLLMAARVTVDEARARRVRPDEMLAGYFLRREEDLRLLLNSMLDAVILTDREFRITAWNQGAEAMYGWESDEVLGRPVAEILRTEYVGGSSRAEAQEELLATGASQTEAVQRRHSGHPIRIVSSVMALKDETGRVVGAVAVNRDITASRLAEEEVKRLQADLAQRAADLEASNLELEAFAYSVSHDLRAPLRGVDGFSQALEEDCADQLDETGKGYLRMLRQNAQRMGRLIDDLLALSRVGRQQLQPQTVRLDDVVQRAWDDLRSDWTDRPVELRAAPLPAVAADATLLKQLYLNLLSNALKFSRGRSPAIIEVGSQEMDGEKVFFVRDNGAGFDMQYVGKIFGVFQRLHRAEDYEGTGVGLAIVQRIVQRHGGRAWAESRLGEGAAFYFTLGGARSE